MPAHKIPLPDRLAKHSRLLAKTGCLVWTGGKKTGGYGSIIIDKRPRLAHRVAYEVARGPIPAGMFLDHICRNRACINPEHLEPVTPLENQLRGAPHQKTHCKNGHPFDEKNTRWRGNKRECRACALARYHRRKLDAFAAEQGVTFDEVAA